MHPWIRRIVAVVATAVTVLVIVSPLAEAGPKTGTTNKGKPIATTSTSTTSTSTTSTSTTSTTVAPPVVPALDHELTAAQGSTLDSQHSARRAKLPARLGLGLKAFPNSIGTRGWMQESGVPWDYAYQYLIGLNTADNWTTWGQGNGRYVVDYAISAAMVKATPSLSYFQINKAAGGCGTCTNIERNLGNLNSPAIMDSWFDDYRTLLQRLSAGTYDGVKGYGYHAIVHVEPDLSGYVQQALVNPTSCPVGVCTAGSTSPSGVAAAVAATGDPELANFPDTYAGFNQAVLALRDKYAPNVSLGYHVSNWAGRWDININTMDVDTVAIADTVAAFARENGAAHLPGLRRYDLLYNDVLDRDAGAYETQFAKADAWWDADNVVLPHFARWETYLGRITSTLRLPAFVWQVPVGNQHFITMDNSSGHTQDNKVEYFMDNPTRLRDIGVWGVLFGQGNPGSTVQWDGQLDGVTNGTGETQCSTRGRSSGVRCWSNVSTVADDDGGYLRLRGQEYYGRGPLAPKAP